MSDLRTDYTKAQVAKALGMSERWVQQQIAAGAAHQRYGNRVRFTPEQVEALRASFASTPTTNAVTSKRGRRAS